MFSFPGPSPAGPSTNTIVEKLLANLNTVQFHRTSGFLGFIEADVVVSVCPSSDPSHQFLTVQV